MKNSRFKKTSAGAAILTLSLLIGRAYPQTATPTPSKGTSAKDPGVRTGAAGAGGAASSLTGSELLLFNTGKATFSEVDSVFGTLPGETDSGLGPSFNMNSCAGCHAFPATGGSSPQVNPQVAVATLHGARNTVPSFITSNGPVREARFKTNPNGTADGGVHDLFVITGRSDAPSGCNLAQTNFAPQVSSGNVIFRIPTPVFGAGLIEAIDDATILANMSANSAAKTQLGISGQPNYSGNDGTMTRFGWKAQNKSLLIFAGEAYAVEQGVTNEAFPNPRQTAPSCDTLGHPEDITNLVTGSASDIVNFAMFMRMLAPPQPATSFNAVATSSAVGSTSIQNGLNTFTQTGCALCHTQSLTSGNSPIAALSNQNVQLFSDLLLHNMGSGLADGISQGVSTGSEFRTAPLWGLGQRIFFLHDGRTSDLVQAIQAHSSQGSEANAVVAAYNALSASAQQDLLNFLRSL
ncbi:MAG: di-heme oxidoredictase family protein [Bryobacteraceae bacterium]|jgi:CxxC motif-containing protein (DUF1111 family)